MTGKEGESMDTNESIDDVRKAKDNAIAFLAQSGVMGWKDLNTFSSDFAQVFDRAYACGRRDGAGERADAQHTCMMRLVEWEDMVWTTPIRRYKRICSRCGAEYKPRANREYGAPYCMMCGARVVDE